MEKRQDWSQKSKEVNFIENWKFQYLVSLEILIQNYKGLWVKKFKF